jgi:hypothetical protein
MPSSQRQQQGKIHLRETMVVTAIAAAVYYPVMLFVPGWLSGTRLPDMDPPFDLVWLHDFFAWTAGNVGLVMLCLFGTMIVALPVIAALTKSADEPPPFVSRTMTFAQIVSGVAVIAVPALAVGWFLLTQIAALIAPFLGMYHGNAVPAVP